jgi:raffinose/stachyose/melibiose transport system permease protein
MNPVVRSLFYSFTDLHGYNFDFNFVGLDNYREAFQDTDFGNSLIITLKYTIFCSIVGTVFSLSLALLLDTERFNIKPLRTVFFLPTVMSGIIVGYVWTFLYGDAYRSLVKTMSIPEAWQISWLGDEKIAIYSVGLTAIWQGAGTAMIIYLAALKSISKDVLESASIDGAGSWTKITKIKLPLIAPIIVLQLILSVSGNLKAFANIFAMTSGGPMGATRTVVYMIYQEAVTRNQTAYGTTLSILLFIIIAVITLILVQYMKVREQKL